MFYEHEVRLIIGIRKFLRDARKYMPDNQYNNQLLEGIVKIQEASKTYVTSYPELVRHTPYEMVPVMVAGWGAGKIRRGLRDEIYMP
ncbi:MAG: hypothetical protein ACWGQW_03350 [bacterium]